MDSTLSASSSSIAGDAAKDLGAPLLPSSGRASFRPTVKRRRKVFDMMFGMLFGIFAFVIVVRRMRTSARRRRDSRPIMSPDLPRFPHTCILINLCIIIEMAATVWMKSWFSLSKLKWFNPFWPGAGVLGGDPGRVEPAHAGGGDTGRRGRDAHTHRASGTELRGGQGAGRGGNPLARGGGHVHRVGPGTPH